jgi:hypothetical protein
VPTRKFALGRQDDVGVPRRLVQVDVDADHEVERGQRAVQPIRVGGRHDRIACQCDQRADLSVARRFDLLGQRDDRELAEELRQLAHAR